MIKLMHVQMGFKWDSTGNKHVLLVSSSDSSLIALHSFQTSDHLNSDVNPIYGKSKYDPF